MKFNSQKTKWSKIFEKWRNDPTPLFYVLLKYLFLFMLVFVDNITNFVKKNAIITYLQHRWQQGKK